MPFKTKKKKLAALKNRVAVSASGAISYTTISDKKPEQAQGSLGGTTRYLGRLDTELNLPGFKREIIKIILLAALIIGFQLALKFSNLPFLK